VSVYFYNEKTGRKYAVVKFDREAGTVTLKGEVYEFTEPFDRAKFEKMGYVLKTEGGA